VKLSTSCIAIAVILLSVSALPQNVGLGVPPFASVTAGTPYEVINNQNLNVHLLISVESVAGRKTTFAFSAINDSQIWKPVNSAWSPVVDADGSPNGGWVVGNPNGRLSRTYVTNGTCLATPPGGGAQASFTRYTESNLVFTDPQGTPHPFLTVTQSLDCVNGQVVISGNTTGYASDASGYFLNAQIGPPDGPANIPVGTVISAGGTQYQNPASGNIGGGGAGLPPQGLIVDTNGNFISTGPPTVFSGNTTVPWNPSTGAEVDVITFPATNVVQYNTAGNNILASVGFQTLPIITSFGCAGISEYSGNAKVVSSILFSNSKSFSFTYEPSPGHPGFFTGRLQKVTLPDGGFYQYAYTGANDGINCADGTTLHMTRTINDGTNSRVWTFARNGSTTTVTAPKLSYDTVANDTTYTFDANGHQTSKKVFQGTSLAPAAPLRTVNTTWAANGTPSTAITILEDGQTQSETDTTFDSNGLLQLTKEYDFGQSVHGPLLRTTTTTYKADPNYLAGSNNINPRNIINLVSEVKVQDGSGVIKSRTGFNYDESGTLTSCPLSMPQHLDSAFGCGFQFRGNLTSVLSYKDPITPANPVVKNLTYDFFGNVLTTSTAGIQQRQNVFSDVTKYSFPDSVTIGPSGGPQLTTSYTYNVGLGQLATSKDANNQVTSYLYDALGRPASMVRPDGTGPFNTYDDPNHKASVTTPIDASHFLVQVQTADPLGNVLTTAVQDGNNNVISIIENQYDELGRLSQVSNPYTGTSPSFFTATQFDALGRPTINILPDGQQTTYTYSLQTATVTDPAGKQVRSKSDAAGRLVEVDAPGGNSAPATPGSGSGIVNGNELSVGSVGAPGSGSVTINGAERSKIIATRFCGQYDLRGRCVDWETDSSTVYDTGTVSVTVNGHTDQIPYGASDDSGTVANRLAAAIRANSPYVDYSSVVINSSTSATINLVARTVGISTDYSLSATSADTDTVDFPTGVSFTPTASGAALVNGSDAVPFTNDSGSVWITVNGFEVQVPYLQGSTRSSLATALVNGFNSAGASSPVNASLAGSTVNLTAKTTGSTTNYSLSSGSISNLPATFPTPSFSIAVSGPNLEGGAATGGPSMATPAVTTYTYNVMDQVTGTATGAQTRTYVYDALGRRTSAATPELAGGATTMQYNDLGLMTQSTDARGVITNYGYDTLNRLTSVSYDVGSTGVSATPSLSYTFGTSAASLNNGRLLTMADGVGSETYSYDILGRKTGCDKVINGITYSTQYQYNLAGEVAQLTYPSGRQVKPGYDGFGRVTGLSDTFNSVNTAYVSAISYNVAQQITQFAYGNGVVANYGYSSDGRQQLTSLQYSKGAQTLFGLNYLYAQNGSNNGQIVRAIDMVDNGRSATYLYDALGRLGQAYTAGSTGFPNWDLAFSYDQYGNRTDETPQADTSPSATVPANHLLFSSSPQTNRITTGGYGYDANGNLTNDGVNTLVYNAANQVVSSNNGAASYIYDGYGVRVRKCGSSCATSSTVYIYAGGTVIAEYDNAATPTAPSREYIDLGGRLAKIEGGAIQYYHPDHLSVRALSDAGGNKIADRGHFPYGEQWYASGSSTKFQFTSYDRDLAETGNDYAMARYYVPRLGQFSSPDPLESSPNGFAYVINDPINHTDSSGMVCDDDCVFNHIAATFGPHETCTIDGLDAPCDLAQNLVDTGDAQKCPENDCSERWDPKKGWVPAVKTVDGQFRVWRPALFSFISTGFWQTTDPNNQVSGGSPVWVESATGAGWWEPVLDVNWDFQSGGHTPMTHGSRSPEEQKAHILSYMYPDVCDRIYAEYVEAIQAQKWKNVAVASVAAMGGCKAAKGACLKGAIIGATVADTGMWATNWNTNDINNSYKMEMHNAGCSK
jgi:RHS repeat-associated protein